MCVLSDLQSGIPASPCPSRGREPTYPDLPLLCVPQLKREQLDALRVELSQQEMSAEDVAKIAQQRTQLKKSIDEVKEEIEQVGRSANDTPRAAAREW